MDLDWNCTDMLKMWHQCQCGHELSARWKDREALVSTSDFTHSTFRQNRVVIASSIIAKVFNPSKCWTVTIQLILNDTLFNQYLLLFLASYSLFDFCLSQCSCSIQCLFDVVLLFDLFFCSVIELFSVCSVLILEMCSRDFDPLKHQSSSSR